jgi:predicted nuclease of predicted toxin-antitoxin system
MRWLVDECVSAGIVRALRDDEHDVIYVAEDAPAAEDIDLLEYALHEQRLLLTEDKDFGELVFGAAAKHSFGIVLMRVPDRGAASAWPRLKEAIDRFSDRLFGPFTVVGKSRFRTHLLD